MAQASAAGQVPEQRRDRKIFVWIAFVGAAVALLLLASQAISALDTFSESWNLGLHEELNELKRWVVVNRNSHPLFVFFFEPLSSFIDFFLRRVEAFILWVPWLIVVLAVFLFAERLRGLALALIVTACLFFMGLFGLWEESMQTLALMVTAVLFALAVGIPLGIWSAQNDRVEQFLRPILDAMQTMPAFVYLIPVLLFFGVARVPSIIATVIYAIPPAIRMTSLGLRSVSEDVLEAATAFGATDRQILRQVKLPLAMPMITVGINQTIMMALSIVVIAALIGAGGLGDVVLKSLRRLQVGQALEAGLAIVLMAILLDRLSAALVQGERYSQPQYQGFRLFSEKQRGNRVVEWIERRINRLYVLFRAASDWLTERVRPAFRRKEGFLSDRWLNNHAHWLIPVLVLTVLAILLRLVGMHSFSNLLRLDISQPVDSLVQWMQVNLYNIGDSGIGTGPLRDFLIIYVFQPLEAFLTEQLPWTVVLFVFVFIAYLAGGWRLALSIFVLTVLIGLLGMWSFAMDTLGQTLVAVVICLVIGIPLGIWAAHNDRVDQAIRPILDFLQTIPIFVYLVPVIMLLGTGSVAGLIAAILYAVVPVVRLTNSGIRGVDKSCLESAESFGCTRWQTLTTVELPLAFPSIMLGINQTTMMVLAMVIIAGLVGATGLGLEVYQGFANDNLGRSVEAGLAIVLMAIVIDRITQQLAAKAAAAANVEV
jgi:glycine betaine/proline transport system permease protein